MSAIRSIENSEVIENIFGCWPSFHDAEIHCIVISRDGEPGPQIDISIHHWQMTSEVDSVGYFVLKHHTLSTLRFSGITDLVLAEFNHQNVISELKIAEIAEPNSNGRNSVVITTSFGCEASYKCKAIRVLSAVPYGNRKV